MAVISRPLDLLELMRELYTEKWNPAAESKEAGLNFLTPPKRHTEAMLNRFADYFRAISDSSVV